MFGISFKSRAMNILKKDFNYPDIHPIQKPIFSSIVEQAKLMRVNEYDAAIMFMMVQLNALPPSDSRTKVFVSEQIQNIECVIPLAASPSADILEMIQGIKEKHFSGKTSENFEFSNFEKWYGAFKFHCSMRHPKLAISKDGSSLIDFMDHAPLRRAFADKVDPDVVAKGFALSFDPKTFGIK